jgi:hypothetical protein
MAEINLTTVVNHGSSGGPSLTFSGNGAVGFVYGYFRTQQPGDFEFVENRSRSGPFDRTAVIFEPRCIGVTFALIAVLRTASTWALGKVWFLSDDLADAGSAGFDPTSSTGSLKPRWSRSFVAYDARDGTLLAHHRVIVLPRARMPKVAALESQLLRFGGAGADRSRVRVLSLPADRLQPDRFYRVRPKTRRLYEVDPRGPVVKHAHLPSSRGIEFFARAKSRRD